MIHRTLWLRAHEQRIWRERTQSRHDLPGNWLDFAAVSREKHFWGNKLWKVSCRGDFCHFVHGCHLSSGKVT